MNDSKPSKDFIQNYILAVQSISLYCQDVYTFIIEDSERYINENQVKDFIRYVSMVLVDIDFSGFIYKMNLLINATKNFKVNFESFVNLINIYLFDNVKTSEWSLDHSFKIRLSKTLPTGTIDIIVNSKVFDTYIIQNEGCKLQGVFALEYPQGYHKFDQIYEVLM